MDYVKRKYRRWTADEISTLMEGKVPTDRDYGRALQKAGKLGIGKPLSPSGKCHWSDADLEILLNEHRIPPGRTLSACQAKLYGRGLRCMPGPDNDGRLIIDAVRRMDTSK